MRITAIQCRTNTGEIAEVPVSEMLQVLSGGGTSLSNGVVPKSNGSKYIASGISVDNTGQVKFDGYGSERAFTGIPTGIIGFTNDGRLITLPLQQSSGGNKSPNVSQPVSSITSTQNVLPFFSDTFGTLADTDILNDNGNYSFGGLSAFWKVDVNSGSVNIDQRSTNATGTTDGYRINGKLVLSFNPVTGELTIGNTTYKTTNIQYLKSHSVQFNTSPSGTVMAPGVLRWNDTDGTLEFGMKGGNVVQQIGQELPILVKHADNSGLTEGTVVYTVGSDGTNKTVRLAKADAESTSSKTFGVMTESATGGNKAFCTTFGLVRNIDTSALTEGAAVYLSPTTAGGMTTTKPSAPNHMVLVGFCINSHTVNGSIFVKVQNGFELDELHDVAISTLTNNNLLTYESATSLWKNKTFAELGLASGTGTVNYVTKWANTTGGLVNSQIFDNGTNVGVGTTSPANKLHVLSPSSTIAMIESSASQAFFGLKAVSGGVVYFGNTNSGDFTIQTAGSGYSDKFYITSSGNVGIGTTSPSWKLDINSSGASGSIMRSVRGTSSFGIYQGENSTIYMGAMSSNDLYLLTNDVTRVSITSAGNVGIGTTSPINKLDIVGASNATTGGRNIFGDDGSFNPTFRQYRWTGGASNYYGSSITTTGDDTGGVPALNLRVATNAAAIGSETFANIMTLTGTGRVGVSNNNPSGVLDISSSVDGAAAYSYFYGNAAGTIPSNKAGVAIAWNFSNFGGETAIVSNRGAGSVGGFNFLDYQSGSAVSLVRILGNGNVGIGTTSPTQRLDVNGTTRTTNLMITNGAAVGKVWQCNNVDGTGAWVTPLASERYIGEWAANSGTAPSASPTAGDYWVVNTAGTYLGIAYVAGDEIYWNGTAWLKRSNFLTLPIATTSTLGGIKIGSNLAIDGGGVVMVASSPILTTTRNISITGDITWNVNFNGSADVTGVGTLATVNSNVGTFRSVTVNAKGLVTAATNPTTLAGFGITDAWTKTESDGRYLYADNKTSFIATTSQLGLIAVGTTLEISGFGVLNQKSGIVTTGTYRSVTVDTYGRVTSGTNPTTLSGYGITNAYTKTESDVNYVSQSVIYSYPSWLAAIDWSIITGKPSSFTPSAHTLDSHSNVTITSNTNGEILRWNGTAWINNTLAEAGIQPAGAYLTGNQTITLSGIITGSGTTAITTAIADNALSIAKTSGLQTALNGKQNQLNGVGFVKANGTTITYDNSTYLTSVSLANTQIGFGNGSNVLSSTASFTYSNSQIHLYGGTGAFNIGKGGIDNEYWIDAASTNLNLYGSRIVSRNNHQFNNGIYAGGTLGSSGQVLSSTGSGVQWITPAAGASLNNTYIGFGNGSNLLSGSGSFTYVDNQIRMYGGSGAFNIGKGGFDNEYWVDAASANLNLYGSTVVARANFQLNAGLRAGGSYGSAGQILSSTGSGVQWINAPSGGDTPYLPNYQIGYGSSSNLLTSSGNFTYDAPKTVMYLNDGGSYLYVGRSQELWDMWDIGGVGSRGGIRLNADLDIVIQNNRHLYLGSSVYNQRVHIGRGAAHNDYYHYLVINGENFSFSMSNISGWGDSNSASTPQVGDKILFNVVDVGGQKRFVPQKINYVNANIGGTYYNLLYTQ